MLYSRLHCRSLGGFSVVQRRTRIRELRSRITKLRLEYYKNEEPKRTEKIENGKEGQEKFLLGECERFSKHCKGETRQCTKDSIITSTRFFIL